MIDTIDPDQRAAYTEQVTHVWNLYTPRALTILNRLKDACESNGLACNTPGPVFGDELRWEFDIKHNTGYMTVEIIVMESLEHEPSLDGINFMFEIITDDAQVPWGYAPYNYSPEVWVDLNDMDAVDERFEMIEDADIGEAMGEIAKFAGLVAECL
jgi:hypothetical protein